MPLYIKSRNEAGGITIPRDWLGLELRNIKFDGFARDGARILRDLLKFHGRNYFARDKEIKKKHRTRAGSRTFLQDQFGRERDFQTFTLSLDYPLLRGIPRNFHTDKNLEKKTWKKTTEGRIGNTMKKGVPPVAADTRSSQTNTTTAYTRGKTWEPKEETRKLPTCRSGTLFSCLPSPSCSREVCPTPGEDACVRQHNIRNGFVIHSRHKDLSS